ncbi:MAG: hypothetical protein H6861_03055 [Rhodospirillales bacterium]|nr:hypothetical protein [Rhodospirillales bacterium]
MIEPVELIGLAAGFLTAFSTVPQSIRIIRVRQAAAVSAGTYFMLLGSYILWLVYGIIQGAISIIFWNVIGIILGAAVLIMKLFIWKD